MIRPELSEAKKYAAGGYRMVPVCLRDVIGCDHTYQLTQKAESGE